MTRDEFQAILNARGGLASDAVVVDPIVDNPDSDPVAVKLKPKVPNPNPTYEYILKDGTHLKARAVSDAEGNVDINNIQITDPGTGTGPPKDTAATAKPTPSAQLDRLDAQGNVIPAGSATPAAKLRDPATGTTIDLPDAKTSPQGTLHEFGNQLLLVKSDGTYTVVAARDPAATAQTKSVVDSGGAKYEYDPSKPAGERLTKILDAPADTTAPTTKTIGGKTYQWNPKTQKWDDSGIPVEPTTTTAAEVIWQDVPGTEQQQAGRVVDGAFTPIAGLTRNKNEATTLIGGANSKTWTFVDNRGNVVRTITNPDYREPPGTQLTSDMVSPNIPILQADGTIKWEPNRNRVPAGQAMQDLLATVGVKVNGGSLSMAEAKDMLTGAVAAMNASTQQQQNALSAAQTMLTNQQQSAQTGAGLLNQRVSAGQGMLSSVLNLAGQRPMVGLPVGTGQALMRDIQGMTAQLGGGQEVYDTAARLVQAADPQGGRSPMAQAAYGVITQILDRYKQQYGQPHPYEAATTAAQQTQQTGAVVAPTTVTTPATTSLVTEPVVYQATTDPRFTPGAAVQPEGTVLPAGVAGTTPMNDPRFLGFIAPQIGATPPPLATFPVINGGVQVL